MIKSEKRAFLEFVSNKQKALGPIQAVEIPPGGWIQMIRKSMGMSLRQLGARLHISAQSVKDIERRESQGSITLAALQEAAQAMDMQLVYAIVPQSTDLPSLIEARARELATDIVQRAHQSMVLEEAQVSNEKIEASIQERTQRLMNDMPRYLWD